MPILNKTSAMNRSACLIEVGDISYLKAMKFLMNGGIADDQYKISIVFLM